MLLRPHLGEEGAGTSHVAALIVQYLPRRAADILAEVVHARVIREVARHLDWVNLVDVLRLEVVLRHRANGVEELRLEGRHDDIREAV